MTKIVRTEDLGGPPEGADPNAFLASLTFDPSTVLDPELEAALSAPAHPLDKVAAPTEVVLRWDYRTNLRIQEIAQTRGITVAELLEELAELELARLDALEVQESRRHSADPHAA
jgi:hypothetical protein